MPAFRCKYRTSLPCRLGCPICQATAVTPLKRDRTQISFADRPFSPQSLTDKTDHEVDAKRIFTDLKAV
jgi:hypothetical protein